jgi:hypothetical protein
MSGGEPTIEGNVSPIRPRRIAEAELSYDEDEGLAGARSRE